MADATNPAAAPVSAASGAAPVDGASSAPARPLPTPEELLATFETLAAEHRVESQRISNLTAQLKGQTALVFLADETRLHLNQYLDSSKAVSSGLVGPALMISMRKKLWESGLVLQNGGLHKQAAEIFVALLPDVVAAYTDTEPARLADAYLQTAKSLTALDLLPRAHQLVEMAQEIERNLRRDMVKRRIGLCANQGCQNKGALKCSACTKESYCSKECQKADWRRRHKILCSGSANQ